MDKMKIALITAIMLLMSLTPAFAAEYNVDLRLDSSFARVGAGSTGMIIRATVTNTGEATDTYTMTPQNNWILINPNTFSLAAGETEGITILLTAPYDAEAKEYDIDITVKSGKSKDTETLTVDVLRVHGVSIDTTTDKTACLGDTAVFDIDVSNTGKTEETFTITSDIGTLEKSKTTLDSGKTETITLTLPATSGKQTSTITVKSQDSYAGATETITLNGVSCYSEEVSIEPESKTVCMNEPAEFKVRVKNTGTRSEDYTIEADYGELSTDTMTVGAGEEKRFILTATPSDVGVYTSNIKITSAHAEYTVKAQVSAQSCKGIAIISIPKEKTVCRGDNATYYVTAKNIGKTEDSMTFSTTMGTLSDTGATIGAGDTKELMLEISTKDLDDDEYTFTVTAESDTKDTTESRLMLEDCYAAEITVEPDTAKVCSGQTAGFLITIENTGKNADTYSLTATKGTLSDDTVTVDAGESKDITLALAGNKDTEAEITIESEYVKATATAALEIKDEDECFGFDISINPESIEATEYKGYLYTITVRNTGEYTSEFTIKKISGPEWTFIDPESQDIESNRQADFFLYTSPPYGTDEGVYSMTIEITRDGYTSKTVNAKMTLNPEGKTDVPVIDNGDAGETSDDTTGSETPKTYQVSIDTEKVYSISPESGATAEGTVSSEGEEDTFNINFRTGSFIIGIGDAVIEDENPELGEMTYELEEDGKRYTVTIEFTSVNTTSDEYEFRIMGTEVTEAGATGEDGTPTGDATQNQAPVSRNLIYAAIIGLVIIILILFGPEIADSTRKFFTEEKKEEKEEETRPEEYKAEVPVATIAPRETKEDEIPLEEIKGIGGKRAEALRKAGIRSVNDLASANITDIMSEAVTSEKQAKDLIKKAKRLIQKTKKEEQKLETEKKKEEQKEKKKEESRKEVKDDIKEILESI